MVKTRTNLIMSLRKPKKILIFYGEDIEITIVNEHTRDIDRQKMNRPGLGNKFRRIKERLH